MSFLYPNFLYALSLIAVPIIIHLFNFRTTKVVYFSNVEFLKNTQSQTRSKFEIKYWLVLLMRILMVTALVFAFAQPFIPATNTTQSGISESAKLLIFIDNSFSMDGETTNGKTIEVAKQNALQIAESYSSNNGIMLLTNDLKSKHEHWVNKKQWTSFVSELQTSARVLPLNEVINRINFIQQQNPNQKIHAYIISDFQKNTSQIEKWQPDTNVVFHLIQTQQETINNLAIDSCWFQTPVHYKQQEEILSVKIQNQSEQTYQNIPVQLFINDTLKGMKAFNIAKFEEKVIQIPYINSSNGQIKAKVSLTDYPITFDDEYYFSYEIKNQINILNIVQQTENQSLEKLFAPEKNINLNQIQISKAKYSDFKKYDLIILDQLTEITSGLQSGMSDFLQASKTLLIIPTKKMDIQSYNSFLNILEFTQFTQLDTTQTQIENINTKHFIYHDIFEHKNAKIKLPYVKKHYLQTPQKIGVTSLLTNTFNQQFLTYKPYKTGQIYLFSMPLNTESTNFLQHPIAIPTLYNIAFYNKFQPTIAYTIGQNEKIEIGAEKLGNDQILTITGQENFEFIPQISRSGRNKINIRTMQMINQAGIYNVYSNKNQIASLAYNYNRKESELQYLQPEEIQKKTAQFSNVSTLTSTTNNLNTQIDELYKGKELWQIFIILALVFVALEILFVRALK